MKQFEYHDQWISGFLANQALFLEGPSQNQYCSFIIC